MGRATLSTRLCAVCLVTALAFARLLCAVHEGEAAGHKPGEVCGLCLDLAKIDHALAALPAPLPVRGRTALPHRPAGRAPLAALVREPHARSPPRHRG